MTDSAEGGSETPQPRFSPNDHGVEYDDIDIGDRVRLNSAHTESEATGRVVDKKLEESISGDKYYAEITVNIDAEHLHSGTVSAEEWAELPQILEVLA